MFLALFQGFRKRLKSFFQAVAAKTKLVRIRQFEPGFTIWIFIIEIA